MTKATTTDVQNPKAARAERLTIRDATDQDRCSEVRLWEALTGDVPGKALMMNGKQIGYLGNTYRERFPYLMTSVDDALALAARYGLEVRGVIRDKEQPGYWKAVCLFNGKPVSGNGKLMGSAITVAVIDALTATDK